IALGITTSGTSPNMLRAFQTSREMGLITIAFTGRDGGPAATMVDFNFTVRTDLTPRIQEVHITLAHVICELVEKRIAQS
ncbi:MAG TPA: phosphoheptose isomerase, partial [Thermodesulfobacteriota bacterium]|nr:phosphoheptose isomerase [Thermodesulfobacteriota bacterium]